jgi:hypothetical protein
MTVQEKGNIILIIFVFFFNDDKSVIQYEYDYQRNSLGS